MNSFINLRKIFLVLLFVMINLPCAYSFAEIDKTNCTINGKKLYGTVMVTEYGIPDFTVQTVQYGIPDLKVKKIEYRIPNSCGEWKFIEYGIHDFKIQFVKYGIPDLRIQFVEHGFSGF